jgi:integrase
LSVEFQCCLIHRGRGQFNDINLEQIMTTELEVAAAALPAANLLPSESLSAQPPAEATTGHRRPRRLTAASAAAYAKDLNYFQHWGGSIPCSAEAVARYISALGSRIAPTTIYRRVMAVRHAHLELGVAPPTDEQQIRQMLRQLQLGFPPQRSGGKGRTRNVAAPRRKEPKPSKPVTRALLARMVDAMHRNALDRRDRALILLCHFLALQRGELVRIDVGDVKFTADALLVTVAPREVDAGISMYPTPTDRTSHSRVLAVPITGGELCAATAVRKWIESAELDVHGGPLFRRFDRGGDPTSERLSSDYVSIILKLRLEAVGVDPTNYSGQSLRTGRLLELAKGVL